MKQKIMLNYEVKFAYGMQNYREHFKPIEKISRPKHLRQTCINNNSRNSRLPSNQFYATNKVFIYI